MRNLILIVAVALTCSGCYGAVGPSVSVGGEGLGVGWEASAGSLKLQAKAGQVFRPPPLPVHRRSPQERITYIALDPWYFVGGSLGYAWSDLADGRPAIGLWEPIPIPLAGISDCNRGFSPIAIVTVGWRYLVGGNEFYIAPKLGYGWCQPSTWGGLQ